MAPTTRRERSSRKGIQLHLDIKQHQPLTIFGIISSLVARPDCKDQTLSTMSNQYHKQTTLVGQLQHSLTFTTQTGNNTSLVGNSKALSRLASHPRRKQKNSLIQYQHQDGEKPSRKQRARSVSPDIASTTTPGRHHNRLLRKAVVVRPKLALPGSISLKLDNAPTDPVTEGRQQGCDICQIKIVKEIYKVADSNRHAEAMLIFLRDAVESAIQRMIAQVSDEFLALPWSQQGLQLRNQATEYLKRKVVKRNASNRFVGQHCGSDWVLQRLLAERWNIMMLTRRQKRAQNARKFEGLRPRAYLDAMVEPNSSSSEVEEEAANYTDDDHHHDKR